ncbi:response regulator [Paenibacillus sp. N1-5-1-14]|uniref:response regulator n=1 Tax=Paenibacillus radicibacter TaxID=2972488 RepID=UPI0021592E01|nr:response regulator [Paenibacillus radicibacter]MCR8643611.1 response regulator [Paenibacillus radicibacter]
MITAFLVDDEAHALHILELFLGQIGEVQVIGRSNNGKDAIVQLQSLKPDVLFLDIEMPEMNGIELAEVVRNMQPDVQIIFVTAYDQYAISAFEQAAIDYMLKPLERERLSKAIARVRKEVNRSEVASAVQPLSLENVQLEQPKLLINMLGPFVVSTGGGSRLKWRTAKEKELLAYLALQGDNRAHRDIIIEDLWPEENYQKAKIYMHTCVSLLRKNLKQFGFHHIVKYENERYFLDMSQIDIDLYHLKQHLKQLKAGEIDHTQMEQVLSHYQGQLLSSEDYVWASQEAENVDKIISQWHLTLIESNLNVQQYEQVIHKAEQLIMFSPYDEELYRYLMQAFQGMGKNDQVHLVYQRLMRKLTELDIMPSVRTKEIYENIAKSS